MSNTNLAVRAGAGNIEDILIISGNGNAESVLPQVVEFDLYEDIFSTFLTGKVVIRDCQALAQFFPFVGHEYLRVTLSTPQVDNEFGKYSGEFFIFSVSDKKMDGDRSAYYVLSFISKEGIVDMNVRLSKTFRGTSDVILTELLGEKGLNVNLENKAFSLGISSNVMTFCSNWWNPSKCIEYVANHSLNNNHQPDFLFYESKYGFVFESLDNLINDESSAVTQSFVFDRYARQMKDKESAPLDIVKEYQQVAGLEIHSGYDYIDRLRNGYYGGSTISFNPLTQQYTHTANQVTFDEQNHLNKFAPYPDGTPMTYYGFTRFAPTVYNNFTKTLDNSDMSFGVRRRTILERLNTTRVNIVVHGRLDYSIGQCVYLTIPSARQSSTKEGDVDTLASGKYLISSIRHVFSAGRHECTMELVKDSYITDINQIAIKE